MRTIQQIQIFFILIVSLLTAVNVTAGTYYSGLTGERVTLEEVRSQMRAGQILIISEIHGLDPHNENQKELMKELVREGHRFSLGMEFFAYTEQDILDQYFFDEISEEEFLAKIRWGKSIPFENYKFQIRFPRYNNGKTFGINLSRTITNKIAKGGFDTLTEEEKKLLPPDFTMGAESYFERFRETMKDHVPEKKINDYFVSQSLWDDTMAWRAVRLSKRYTDQVFVIIVGDFHVAYQDGLVARLQARGAQDVVSISQIDTRGLSPEEKMKMIQPDPKYGPRATFIYDVE